MSTSWKVSGDAPPQASQLIIERAHEEFLSGNRDDPRLRQVRPLVRQSWERAWQNRVRPEGIPPLDLADDELEQYLRTHPLAAVKDLIRGLLLPGAFEDSGVVVAVGDEAGRLLWVDGDRRMRGLTAAMGFLEGANWSEDSVGTAAPGTALRLGETVQIRGAEHYNRLVHPWSCTAAPVRDPETNRVLGVIDITGGDEVVSTQAKLLVAATARAVESELMLARLRQRGAFAHGTGSRTGLRERGTTGRVLHVLGRDRGLLQIDVETGRRLIELSPRHAAIMLMLAVHRPGLSAQRLTELVYGDGASPDTLRPEMVRLRKVLEHGAVDLIPQSHPYRLPTVLETDAHQVLSLLDRGAHRAALTAYQGPVLPESTSPGAEEFRESVRAALRESILSEASLDVLLAYAEIPEARDDADVLRLALELLPARSPRRAGLVARIERLHQVF